MTVPPTSDTTMPQTAAFDVSTNFATTANWIQDAEAIAKADINRLEGKLKRFCSSLTASLAVSIVALFVAVFALSRSCH